MAHSHPTAPLADAHAPETAARARGLALAELSLLRMSATDRLIGASLVVVILWAGVYWALH